MYNIPDFGLRFQNEPGCPRFSIFLTHVNFLRLFFLFFQQLALLLLPLNHQLRLFLHKPSLLLLHCLPPILSLFEFGLSLMSSHLQHLVFFLLYFLMCFQKRFQLVSYQLNLSASLVQLVPSLLNFCLQQSFRTFQLQLLFLKKLCLFFSYHSRRNFPNRLSPRWNNTLPPLCPFSEGCYNLQNTMLTSTCLYLQLIFRLNLQDVLMVDGVVSQFYLFQGFELLLLLFNFLFQIRLLVATRIAR